MSGIDAKKAELDRYISYIKNHKMIRTICCIAKTLYLMDMMLLSCVYQTPRAHTAIYMAFGDDRFHVAMTGTMARKIQRRTSGTDRDDALRPTTSGHSLYP
jgi:hypothetical protein